MSEETFESFNLHPDLFAGIQAMGYKKPTPIQQRAIPDILANKDMIACAQTGTGKTAAYLLPLLNKISHANHDHTSTLILVPTRELAKQIDEQIEGFAYFVSAQSIAIYGGNKGESWDAQKKAITSGADIIVATPGRFIAHMNMGYVNLDRLEYLILDEADKMLDMGFMDDIMRIVRQLPQKRQTLLFSATMPHKIRELARKILHDPTEISLAVSKPAEGIDQRSYLVYDKQKLPLLQHLIKELEVQSMIIFTSRKSAVNDIVKALRRMGHSAEGIMSDRTQEEREAAMQGFRNKQFKILVATDILSRGIDVDNISHIINFDVPHDAEDYIHRIGRTARADTTGTAITFINEKENYRVSRIERLIEKELPKLPIPAELGSAPEVNGTGAKKPSGPNRNRNRKPGKVNASDNGAERQKKPFRPRQHKPKDNAASPPPATTPPAGTES